MLKLWTGLRDKFVGMTDGSDQDSSYVRCLKMLFGILVLSFGVNIVFCSFVCKEYLSDEISYDGSLEGKVFGWIGNFLDQLDMVFITFVLSFLFAFSFLCYLKLAKNFRRDNIKGKTPWYFWVGLSCAGLFWILIGIFLPHECVSVGLKDVFLERGLLIRILSCIFFEAIFVLFGIMLLMVCYTIVLGLTRQGPPRTSSSDYLKLLGDIDSVLRDKIKSNPFVKGFVWRYGLASLPVFVLSFTDFPLGLWSIVTVCVFFACNIYKALLTCDFLCTFDVFQKKITVPQEIEQG